MQMPAASALVLEHLADARLAVARVARRTPVLPDEELSERLGGAIVLKAESLQRTGSFKVRGAAARMALLRDAAGVVAASAGNHAQGVALAAREMGMECDIFMPECAPATKVHAVRVLGAHVHFAGETVAEALAAARDHATATERELVHPFEDPVVIAGQATIADELLAQVPGLARVIVPVGGGGLAAGIAVGLRAGGSDAQVVGVQADMCAPLAESLREGRARTVRARATIADGIAVETPGELALALLSEHVKEVAVVSEDDIGAAMAYLAERAHLVVEGAGAAGLAALMHRATAPAPDGVTAVVLSGGNVDASVLAQVARRRETQAGRRLAVLVRVADRPGGLAGLLGAIARSRANVVDIDHLREGVDLDIGETVVQLVLETRGREHAEDLLAEIERRGYRPSVMH
jgi:threonine dehydratase